MLFIESKDNYEYILKAYEEGRIPTLVKEIRKNDDVAPLPIRKPLNEINEVERGCLDGDRYAKRYLVKALPNSIYIAIDSYIAKGMWDQVAKMMRGSEVGNQLKINSAITKFNSFKQRRGESLTETYERLCLLLNELKKNKIVRTNIENALKFLNNLLPEWKVFASHVRHNKLIETISINDLYETLLQDEDELLELMGEKKANEKTQSTDPIALLTSKLLKASHSAIPLILSLKK